MDRNGKSNVFYNPNSKECSSGRNEESSEFPLVPFSGVNLFKGYEEEQKTSSSTDDRVTMSNEYLFFSNFDKQHKKVRSSKSSTPNIEKGGVEPIIEKNTDEEEIIINHDGKSTKKCESISEDSISDDFNHSNETIKDLSHMMSGNSSTPSNFSELNKKTNIKSLGLGINEALLNFQNNDNIEKNRMKNNEDNFPKHDHESKSNLNKTIEDFRNFTTSSYTPMQSRKENDYFKSLFDPLKTNSFVTGTPKNPSRLNAFSSSNRSGNLVNPKKKIHFNPPKHVNKMFSINEDNLIPNLDEKLRTKPKTDILNFEQINKTNLLHDFSRRNNDNHKSNLILKTRDFEKSKFKSSTDPYLARLDPTNTLKEKSPSSRVPLTGSTFYEKYPNMQSTECKITQGRNIYQHTSSIKIPGVGGTGQSVSEVIDKYSKNFMNSNNRNHKIALIETFRKNSSLKRDFSNHGMVNTLNNGMQLKSEFRHSNISQIPLHNGIENVKESTLQPQVAIQESNATKN